MFVTMRTPTSEPTKAPEFIQPTCASSIFTFIATATATPPAAQPDTSTVMTVPATGPAFELEGNGSFGGGGGGWSSDAVVGAKPAPASVPHTRLEATRRALPSS